MTKLTIATLTACLACAALTVPARAEVATMDEALTVAANWISLIMQKQGSWGDSSTAEVTGIQEFRRGWRVIGYFCSVEPKGFIVASRRKELAPVNVYSVRSDLDPEAEEGMADLIKAKMERLLSRIEEQEASIKSARAKEASKSIEINYRNAWRHLGVDMATFRWNLASGVAAMNVENGEQGELDVETLDYQAGQVLLTTDWHQSDPFNRQCPAPPVGDDCTEDRCVVGCVATAGAQIMRHWCWPPYGQGASPYDDNYDWPNMPDTLTGGSPSAQIDAVAELCSEVGIAVNMDYCCTECSPDAHPCASAAYTSDMVGVFEGHYRYSTDCRIRYRSNYSAVDWFERMKTQFNANRPVQYVIPYQFSLSLSPLDVELLTGSQRRIFLLDVRGSRVYIEDR